MPEPPGAGAAAPPPPVSCPWKVYLAALPSPLLPTAATVAPLREAAGGRKAGARPVRGWGDALAKPACHAGSQLQAGAAKHGRAARPEASSWPAAAPGNWREEVGPGRAIAAGGAEPGPSCQEAGGAEREPDFASASL